MARALGTGEVHGPGQARCLRPLGADVVGTAAAHDRPALPAVLEHELGCGLELEGNPVDLKAAFSGVTRRVADGHVDAGPGAGRHRIDVQLEPACSHRALAERRGVGADPEPEGLHPATASPLSSNRASPRRRRVAMRTTCASSRRVGVWAARKRAAPVRISAAGSDPAGHWRAWRTAAS